MTGDSTVLRTADQFLPVLLSFNLQTDSNFVHWKPHANMYHDIIFWCIVTNLDIGDTPVILTNKLNVISLQII